MITFVLNVHTYFLTTSVFISYVYLITFQPFLFVNTMVELIK